MLWNTGKRKSKKEHLDINIYITFPLNICSHYIMLYPAHIMF